jgi:hypothetical protein
LKAIIVEGVQLPPHMDVELLAIRPLSHVEGDEFLSVVLARRIGQSQQKDRYITWDYNWQTKGCSLGIYRQKIEDAFNDFCTRGMLKAGMSAE